MAAAWPGTLPNFLSADSFRRLGPGNTVWSTTLSGRIKSRRISTKTSRQYEAAMVMTADQVATFDSFYRSTLGDGSLPFQGLTNPLEGGADTVWQFMADPTTQPYRGAGNVFLVTLPLLALPDTPV